MRRRSLPRVDSFRRTLNAEQLGDRVLPAGILAVGSDAGVAATVRTFIDSDDDGTYETLAGEFQPYGGFTGGVRVATGDFDGDGDDELVTGTGRYGNVKVWELNADGTVGELIDTMHPFGEQTASGVFVAAGDLDGDGRDELVVSRASGGNGVRIYSDVNGNGLISDNQTDAFVPFKGIASGTRVAVGDTNGDGFAELIIGTGLGRVAQVRVYSDADQDRAVSDGAPVETFLAFGPQYTGGVFVAAGALDGIGGEGAEVVVGRASGGSTVKVFTDSDDDGKVGDTVAQTFQAGGTRGARVAVGDTDGDGEAEVVTATGSKVSVKDTNSTTDEGVSAANQSFNPFPAGYSGNLFVAFGEVNRSVISLPLPNGPITIPGIIGDTTVSLTVGDEAGTISDLNVDLSLLTGLLGDSTVTLTHVPSGTSATLFDGSSLLGGLLGADGLNVHIDDDAGTDILEGDLVDGILTGVVNPAGDDVLSVFNGLDASGEWQLTIGDDSLLNLEAGSLLGLTLDFLF